MNKLMLSVVIAVLSAITTSLYAADPTDRQTSTGRQLVLSLGGYPNFLYFTSYDKQIAERLTPLLKKYGVNVTIEYHPWATVPKFIMQFDHGTVAPVYGDGRPLVKGYIYSKRFDIDVDRDLAVIMRDSVENRLTMELIDHALSSTTK